MIWWGALWMAACSSGHRCAHTVKDATRIQSVTGCLDRPRRARMYRPTGWAGNRAPAGGGGESRQWRSTTSTATKAVRRERRGGRSNTTTGSRGKTGALVSLLWKRSLLLTVKQSAGAPSPRGSRQFSAKLLFLSAFLWLIAHEASDCTALPGVAKGRSVTVIWEGAKWDMPLLTARAIFITTTFFVDFHVLCLPALLVVSLRAGVPCLDLPRRVYVLCWSCSTCTHSTSWLGVSCCFCSNDGSVILATHCAKMRWVFPGYFLDPWFVNDTLSNPSEITGRERRQRCGEKCAK